MAHYFDDMFQRTIDSGTPRSSGLRHVRRSSIARSIGARSDFDTSVNGADDDGDSAVYDDTRSKEKAEADEHMHHYIADQLSRYKTQNRDFEHEDEFETQA